jgi:transcription initiation factor TFIID TATA-box-binding protein
VRLLEKRGFRPTGTDARSDRLPPVSAGTVGFGGCRVDSGRPGVGDDGGVYKGAFYPFGTAILVAMSAPADSIEIQNVVASTGIGQELDLEALATDLPGADFNPDNFPGLVYRTQEPKAAALIFRSGKIVCTGAKSIADVHTALDIIFGKLRELGIPVEDTPEITVQNIVSSADLSHSLNLNALAIGLGLEDVEYEPEQFPGLVYRMADPEVVILLFGSGKVVITGGKTVDDASGAVEQIVDRINDLGLLG